MLTCERYDALRWKPCFGTLSRPRWSDARPCSDGGFWPHAGDHDAVKLALWLLPVDVVSSVWLIPNSLYALHSKGVRHIDALSSVQCIRTILTGESRSLLYAVISSVQGQCHVNLTFELYT